MSPPSLVARRLCKAYAGRAVLTDFDLELAPGDIVCLAGPNGSGKTTLLACLAGVVVPDRGEIVVAGHDLAREPITARRALRYVAQETEFPPGVTGREVVEFYASVFESPGDLASAQALTELGEALERPATTLSVGMRRRLALCVLSIGVPAVALLDEPFAGLDTAGTTALLSQIEHARERGVAVVFSAHGEDIPRGERLGAKVVQIAPRSSSPPR